jgi:parallel beta-helix repeat protein
VPHLQCRCWCLPARSALLLVLAAGLFTCTPTTLHAAGPVKTGLYVPPVNAYIIAPGETPVTLTFGSAAIADVQAQLDAARAANADMPILLTLGGDYTVADFPLTLPSRTSVVLYGTIRAAQDATASSLIAITGQSKVGIAGGLLDGRGANLAGIAIDASSKIDIDEVTIVNTGRDGITFNGNGNDVWDQGSAITRCDIARAGGNGITVRALTQALILDNSVHNNAAVGIQSSGTHGSIVNNTSHANDIGMLVDATDNVIADNELSDNRHAGLILTSTSANSAVLRNAFLRNHEVGLDLDGGNHLVYANDFANANDLIEHTSTNWIVPRGRPLPMPFTMNQYFYPPTADNPHSDPRVVNTRNRTDVTVGSATIGAVQQTYDAARTQHPDDVIVLHLTGDFQLDGSPLLLGSNTALLLDGTIHVTSTTAPQAIIATNPVSYLSLSGGTINCGGRVMEGISIPSGTMTNLDGVTVTHCGEQNPRSASNAIHFARGSGYNILRGNRVDIAGGRCIWTQNANSRYIVLENHTSNCNQDGVDFDSSTSNSVAANNVSEDNLRYGIFIEQSDSLNTVYGNFTTTRGLPNNTGHSVGVYNNATSAGTRSVTDKNTVFSNTSDIIANGLRVGSIATATGGRAETAHSFLFNNQVLNTNGDGILFDTQFERSVQNYFSQTVLIGNRTDLNSHPVSPATPPDFFNPASALNLALKHPATASSSAELLDPADAVDGLSFTGWTAGEEVRPWLTIDLGEPVTFQRLMLKQPPVPTFTSIELQTSMDGVQFTTVAVSLTPDPVLNLTFQPVTARFVRIQIEGALGLIATIQEVSVRPQ